MIGHSLGEVSAAYVAGALTLGDAAQVICARARLLRRPSCRGAMVVAELTLAEARELISGHEHEVSVAAANSHRSMVLSGDPDVLTDLANVLEQRSRFCRRVKVDVASHSPKMDSVRPELKAALAGLTPTSASIPMYSTVTGDVVASPLDATYWVENLCSPVHFSAATRRLLEAGHDLFLEVSPHPILLSAVREDAEDTGCEPTLLPSMRNDDGGRATPLASLGSLYTHGQPVVWEQLYPWGGRCVAAPTYPWQRRHFWTEATATSAATVASDAPAPPAGFDQLPWRLPLHSAVDPQTSFCEIELSTQLMPVLSDHQVHGAVVVPAATLLKLVLSAAAATFGPAKRVLRDVDFRQSLLLADGEQRTVQVVLHQDAWGAARFECFSLDSGSVSTPGSPKWSLLASGAVAADEEARPDGDRHPPELIASSCPDTIAGSSFYRRLAEHGLQYGPAFATVEQLWRRDGEAVARLTAADEGHREDADGRVLDACFQVLAATLATTGSARDTYLPVGVAELRTHETSAGGAWSHAQLRPASDPEPDTIEGDVFLLRDDGQVAMSARGLRLRRIPGDRPATTNRLRDNIFELQWHLAAQTPTETPALKSAPPGSWLIFSDGSATSDMLRAQLERLSQICVIVEPGAEFERRGPLEYRVDPAQPKHFRRLVEDAFGLDRRPCRGVVHLWSLLAGTPSEASTEWLNSAQVAGAASVLHLTQALTLAGWSEPPRMWLVTNGAQVVNADDVSVTVAAAPLWGMGRSIALEHPELRCARVDLPARPGPDELSALTRELWADGSEPDVALRGTSRYVARLTRRDDTAAPTPRRAPSAEAAFRMEYAQAGVLDDVRAVAATRPSPRVGEVELRVHAAGLNFIDAMRALGVYPGQVDGPVRVGIECAGIVTAVGADVKELRVGDAVFALAMDGVGSYVTTPASLVAAKPAQLSFEAAAALPIAYLTAYYSLHEQARLRRGEHVLIHSGAGGVGMAALQVARWLGATVYATAGTAEKREHLHALGVEHVFDSRSLAFADEVLSATGGKGVDVVLNSLTGEAIAKGLEVLRPSGRFVEIGKRDIYGHGSLRLWQLRNNASYMVVDLAQLVVDRPDYVGDLLRKVAAGIAQGAWAPPPVRTFPVADTAAAVRCLAQGKQIGKVVVSVETGASPAVHTSGNPIECEADATYLITGGLGGLGRAVATWLVERGARHLMLMGRTPPSTSAQQTLDALRKAGAHVVVARGDVANAAQLASVIESIRVSMPPLRGVVHAAGVLDDGAVVHLDQRRLRDVMAPKVDGAWNLHALTRDADLDFFVLFSSAASVLGSPGQAHYAAANSFLDALAWHRRAEGRAALSINWGPWAEVGLVARPEQVRQLTRHGIEPMSVADGVATLSQLLSGDATQAAVLDIDWTRWRSGLPQGMEPALLADLVPERGAPAPVDERTPAVSLGDEVRRAAATERSQLLESYLRAQVAAKLGLAPERLAVESPLNNLGVDSLIATELRTQIERDLGVAVPVIELLDGPSIATLAGRLDGRLSDRGSALDPVHADIHPTPNLELPPDDSARWIDLLAKVPETSDAEVDELLRELLATREVDSDG